MARYIPGKGDFITLSFDPQSGHEQMGRRPGIVISNIDFNRSTGMAIICPITNTARNNPFRIPISGQSSLTGYIMVDQQKSLDYTARNIKYIETAPPEIINEILALTDAIIFQ